MRSASESTFASERCVLEDRQGAGPIARVAAALEYAQAVGWEAVLTVPFDTPFLPSDLLERLAEAVGPGALAAVAKSATGRLHPSCSLRSSGALAHLPSYLFERRSLRGFADVLEAAVVEWPTAPVDPFFNVDTADDPVTADQLLKNR